MLKILDPTSGPVTGKLVLAPRPTSLNGKRLAVLWNGRTHGDEILREILERLRQEFSFEVVEFLRKPYIGNVAPKEYFERIIAAKSHLALVGVGD